MNKFTIQEKHVQIQDREIKTSPNSIKANKNRLNHGTENLKPKKVLVKEKN